jgi:recombination protein RecT
MTESDLKDRAQSASQRTDKPNGNADQAAGKQQTALEKRQSHLIALINSMKPEIAKALPRHISAERIARIAMTALRQTPKLASCTPESFLGALLTAAQLGLEVNTPEGEAYLIPYGNECTFVIGYRGLTKLYWQHPQAKHIDAQAVYDGDEFDYAYGLEPFLKHKPAPDGRRGTAVTHYYAVATLQGGGSAFVVLSPDQVKELRNGKVGPSGDIADPMRWMERKTALRQVCKILPKTPELQAAIAADEQVRTDFTQPLAEMQLHAPQVIDVTPEPPAAPAEPAGDVAAPEQQVAEQPQEPVAQSVDGEDACPVCGDIPRHEPKDCPMAAEIAAQELPD